MCNKCRNYITVKTGKSFDALDWEANECSSKTKQKCLCGKDISNLFELSSSVHNLKLVVGCVCIKNTFTDNKEMINKVTKTKCDICDKEMNRSSYVSHLKSKRHIANENKLHESESESDFEIDLDDWSDELYTDDEDDYSDLDDRLCIDCSEDIFDQPKHYTRCKKCFLSKIKKDNKNKPDKKCSCGKSIKPTFKYCYPCYKKRSFNF